MTTSAETILIVDDDDVIVELYSTILEAAGWANRLLSHDSRDVMQLIRENDVSAILLDLYMPNISGKELLEQVAREYPEIPVIILTGFLGSGKTTLLNRILTAPHGCSGRQRIWGSRN